MNPFSRRLTPRCQRLLILLGTASVLLTLIFVTSKRQNHVNSPVTEPSRSHVDLTGVPPGEQMLNRIAVDIDRIREQQQATGDALRLEIDRLQKEVETLNRGAAQVQSVTLEAPAQPSPMPDVLEWDRNQSSFQLPEYDDYETVDEKPPPQTPRPIRLLGSTPSNTANLEEEETITEEPPVLLSLPAGSIVSGQLITGLDVPTGQGARREPYPALLRISAAAILPNHRRTNVRDCFVLASGYGDLSSERAYLRSETLSCVLEGEGGDQVIERQLEGYLVGEDGKAGLRGRLVSKQGQVMAKAAMSGFLGGVSEAFAIKPISIFSPISDARGEMQSAFQSGLKGSEALGSSLIRGSNHALEKLADFYLKLADQMVPVIEISAERQVDLILTHGLKN